MKILHIYKDYFPVLGGIENHIRLLAQAQAARGHDVTVLVTSLNRESRIETIQGVRVIFSARLVNLSSAPLSIELFQRAAEIETDIAHLHSPYPFGEIANYFFGRPRATVLTYHSDIVRQKIMGALYTLMLHRVLARVHTIIATSPNYVESSRVLERWRAKCVVVPLASDMSSRIKLVEPRVRDDTSSPPLPPSPDAKSPLGVGRGGENATSENGGNVILKGGGGEFVICRQAEVLQGRELFIAGTATVPYAHLTIVGTGPMEAEWKRLANSLSVTARVTWAGEVSDAEMHAYYEACDVFVLPCSERSEAFGLVPLEAMAEGKPVVSCDVQTGVAWVNQNEITGLVVPPKNPAALADALGRLLNGATLRTRMGDAGRKRVEQEFTVEKMVERVMRVYEDALAGK